MFKSARELKAFITWASKNHVKRVKVDNVEIEISDLAFIPEYNPPKQSQRRKNQPEQTQIEKETGPIQVNTDEEDPDLYFSVTN